MLTDSREHGVSVTYVVPQVEVSHVQKKKMSAVGVFRCWSVPNVLVNISYSMDSNFLTISKPFS